MRDSEAVPPGHRAGRPRSLQRLDGGAPLAGRHLHQVKVASVQLGVCRVLVLGVHLARAQRTVVLTLKQNGRSTASHGDPEKGHH